MQKIVGKQNVVALEEEGYQTGTLVLEDGTRFEGRSFGSEGAKSGETVFVTGMTGYPEALTDPSFGGQILVMTYPLIGSYGVPEASRWERQRISVSGLVVSQYVETPSHYESVMRLDTWLKEQRIPALEIKDTRQLTQHIRTHGTMLGKIIFQEDIPFYDPNRENLVEKVSTGNVRVEGQSKTTIALIDCGAKANIERCLLKRGVRVITVPWDYDLFNSDLHFDGILVSNGPGNPITVGRTVETLKIAIERNVPMLGICLGHQLLTLAAGGEIYKLKFGHRSQNQPCYLEGSKRCYITTQNHSFAVGSLPPDFLPWFTNANDGSNEGIRHKEKAIFSVQFHPEAAPGPEDTEWIFDYFLERVRV